MALLQTLTIIREWPRWKRLAAAAVVSPCLLAVVVSASFYLYLHRSAAAMAVSSFSTMPPPETPQRLLVISPHCDDETLGAGGLIAEATRRGVPVTVAFLTNGDGFPLACALSLKRTRLRPADYIRFGELRQQEALAALSKLGVPAANVSFLGYPDSGLKTLWETNWSPDKPLRSRFTGQTTAPYGRCFTPKTTYCGQSVRNDIERLIAEVRPTDIYVTHPADDHVDHAAAPAFTQAAIAGLQAKGQSFAARIALHYYIIHRGDWPLPQGTHPGESLTPPAGLLLADTQWQTIPLSAEAQTAKAAAMDAYHSQTEVIGRLMHSFLRTNEVFGEPNSPVLMRDGAAASVRDAPGDDVVRFANPAADLTGLTLNQRGGSVVVRLQTRGTSSAGVRYTLHIRAEKGGYLQRSLTAPALASGSELSCTIPLRELGLSPTNPQGDLWVLAETGITSRLVVDQTGYRCFHLK